MKQRIVSIKGEKLKQVPDGFAVWVKICQEINTYTCGQVITLLSENNPDVAIQIFDTEQGTDMPAGFTKWFEELHKNKHSEEYMQLESLLEFKNFAAIKALFHKSIHGAVPSSEQ